MEILYVYRYKYIPIIITLWFLYMSFVAYHLRLVDSLHSRSQYWFPHTWKWTFLVAEMSFLFMHMLTPPVVRIFLTAMWNSSPLDDATIQPFASFRNVVYSYNLFFSASIHTWRVMTRLNQHELYRSSRFKYNTLCNKLATFKKLETGLEQSLAV